MIFNLFSLFTCQCEDGNLIHIGYRLTYDSSGLCTSTRSNYLKTSRVIVGSNLICLEYCIFNKQCITVHILNNPI